MIGSWVGRHLPMTWIATAVLTAVIAATSVMIDERIIGIESGREMAVRDSLARRPDNLKRILDSARVLSAAGHANYMIKYFLAVEGLQDSTFTAPTRIEVRRAWLLRYGAWYPAIGLVLLLPFAVLVATWRQVHRLHAGQLIILSLFLTAICWFLLAALRFFEGMTGGSFSGKVPTFWVEFGALAALLAVCSSALVALWWSWFGARRAESMHGKE